MPENIPVILKVIEIRAQTQWAGKTLGTTPIENLLYQVNIPSNDMTETPNGYIISQGGLTLILRALEGVLHAEF